MKTFISSFVFGAVSLVSAMAAAEGSIKVECWGNCGSVNLGQVCDSYSTGAQPVAVACDDTADPGFGGRVTCGSSTCTPYGSLYRTDLLSAYCADGGGNDAIVTCKTAYQYSSGAASFQQDNALDVDVDLDTEWQKNESLPTPELSPVPSRDQGFRPK